jgi:N-acetylneuraminic acid mutarotase
MKGINISIGIGIGRKRKNWSRYWATHYIYSLSVTTISDTEQTITTILIGVGYTGISVEYSLDGLTNWIIKGTSVNNTYNATGLIEGTIYYWRARLYSGSNFGNYSNIYSSVTEVTILRDGNTTAFYDSVFESSITKDASDLLSKWSDKLDSGNDLIQSTDLNKPKKSNDVIKFNGTSNYMAAAFTYSQPEFIYAIIHQLAWTNNDKIFDGTGASARGLLFQGTTTPKLQAYAGTASSENSNLPIKEWGIVRLLFNGASSKLKINDTIAITGNFGAQNMGGITLGSSYLFNSWGNFAIMNLILRKVADSTSNETLIYNYLVNVIISYEYNKNISLDGHIKLTSVPQTINQHGFESCNGKLYAIGGNTQIPTSVNLKTVYEYDPVANSWSTKTPLPIAEDGCQSPILRSVGNKLYFIGGLLTGNVVTNKCFEYDPSIDTWTEKASMPTPREDFGSAVYNGKIYCFGGLTNPSNTTPTTIMEVYDPTTDTWDETRADLPVAKWSGDFGCECNGKIYAISSSDTFLNGGVNPYPYTHPVTTVYEYDPILNSWSTKTPIPVGCMYKCCVSIGTDIYVIGGQVLGDYHDCNTKTNAIYKYNTLTDTWSKIVNMPYSAFGCASTILNNKIYISGGVFNFDYDGLWRLNI